ncbi:DinB family protein [Candidatus Binatus sp.]|uniref:DinB family protein n=1 Tax=Candidatus Binatus sp. TaxID=2811406 RepID=UPI00351D6CA5
MGDGLNHAAQDDGAVQLAHESRHLRTHYFNHQTHHRGQLTAMMHQLGRDPSVTDLLAMFRTAV